MIITKTYYNNTYTPKTFNTLISGLIKKHKPKEISIERVIGKYDVLTGTVTYKISLNNN
jgi:hypothetical protein